MTIQPKTSNISRNYFDNSPSPRAARSTKHRLQEKGGLPGPAGTNTILEAAGGLGVPQKPDHPGEARFDYRNLGCK